MRCYNLTKQCSLVERLEIPRTLFGRMRGLLGRSQFNAGDGILFTSNRCVHTFFMGYPIDVIFVDQNYRVVKLCPQLLPYRLSPIAWSAKHTLELPVGTIAKTGTTVNDQLKLME